MDNLGGESTKRKSKSMKMGRSSLRLRGWLKYRIGRSSRPWLHVRLESFCDMTGLNLRTAKRALNTLRESESDLVFRTIHQNRRWKVVVSSTERLHGLNRSEPFDRSRSGGKQIIKEKMLGDEIKHEQMIIGKDKVFWNAKPANDNTRANEEAEEKEDPNQMKLDLRVSDKNQSALIEGKFYEFKDKRKSREQARFYALKQRNLAFVLAKEMKSFHYENIKIRYESRHAFVFALESIKRNVNRKTIVKAYDLAVHEAHADAVDQGITQPAAWAPSSTIFKARRILREGGCYGRWKSSFVCFQN